MLCDTDGFAIPFSLDDEVIEAPACDPDAGDPAEWPSWCDEHRWEPSDEDCRWAAEHFELPPADDDQVERSDADWDELHAQTYGGITDEDLAAAGLAVG
jgi:hypothetical protein